MNFKNECEGCIHSNTCKVKNSYQEELKRLKIENESEEKSFITLANCNNYNSPKLSHKPSYRYTCYFKSDLPSININI